MVKCSRKALLVVSSTQRTNICWRFWAPSHPYGQSKEHANQVQTEFLLVFLSVGNIPVSQVLSQVGGLLQQNEISRFLKGTSLFPHQDNMGYISCVLLCIATGAADAKTHTSPLLRQHSLPPFQLWFNWTSALYFRRFQCLLIELWMECFYSM